MKLVLPAVFFLCAALAQALELTSQLDLSNLYGPTSAGNYSVKLEIQFHSKITATAEENLISPHDDQPTGEDLVCQTSLTLPAGVAIITLTDNKTGLTKKMSEKVRLTTRHISDTAECIDPTNLLAAGAGTFGAHLEFKSWLELNYKAPEGYQNIRMWLSALPFGYNVKVSGKFTHGTFIFHNLESQIKTQIKSAPEFGLSYYVAAINGATALSLGSGLVPLK